MKGKRDERVSRGACADALEIDQLDLRQHGGRMRAGLGQLEARELALNGTEPPSPAKASQRPRTRDRRRAVRPGEWPMSRAW